MTSKARFSVNTAFNWILLSSKSLGVFPFDQERAAVSPAWALYSFLLIALLTVVVVLIVFNPPESVRNSFIHNLLFRCQMLALCTCTITFYLSVCLKRARLADLFVGLRSLKGLAPEKEPRFRIIILYVVLQSLAIALTALFDFIGNQPLTDMLTFSLCYYYAMLTIISSGTLPFVSILEVICCRFEAITSTMRSLANMRAIQYYLNDLLRVVYIYNKSVSLITALNDAFSFQLLFISFVSFINVTTNMYFIVDYIVNTKIRNLVIQDKTKILPVNAGWIILFSTLICFPIHSCQRVAHQAKEFNILLYQLMIDDETSGIVNNKKLRLHIAMKREVVFTACGFFNLDYTLVHSMIAAATTYLVILIQFGQPNDSSKPGAAPDVNSTFSLGTSTQLPP